MFEDSAAREWYTREAAAQTWSVRTLQRNISSKYYHRLLQSQNKDLVEKEMLQLTAPTQVPDKLEFVKNPVVAELLGLQPRAAPSGPSKSKLLAPFRGIFADNQ